ncbi:glomulin isoform X1 [Sabethes cyaneus]|uniref:glomulin isoform X1 n=1 Tax=Sabethes cyaneus TaxID=53552 RepID=UPI00237E358A|nr:glomulin isoform X1 [Sabethes cyaneus]
MYFKYLRTLTEKFKTHPTYSTNMNIVEQLQNKLNIGKYEEVVKFLQNEKFDMQLNENCMDIVLMLVVNINENTLRNNNMLYTTCENLLKLVASKCSPQEVLLVLLERIEYAKHDDVFTSQLKVLQVVLMRLNESKVKSLEWSLNSVLFYIKNISLPPYIISIEEDEENLLESDEKVQRLLQLYMTVLLFLQPIVEDLRTRHRGSFHNNTTTKLNVIICFILQLMGEPLILLNARNYDKTDDATLDHVKSYTRQVVEDLVLLLSKVLGDSFYLLRYGEQRIRWPKKIRSNLNGVLHEFSKDIFMDEEKCPLLSLAMLCYLVVGECCPPTIPAVYSPNYVFEVCLYHCVQLIKHEKPAVHYKGIVIVKNMLRTVQLKADDLDLKIHQCFCTNLTQIIVYSKIERNRKEGTFVLRDYIHRFDKKGRYMLIANLLKTVHHNGLHSFIATLYKDFVHSELLSSSIPSSWYSGKSLKRLIMKEICVLKNGIETDLMENSDSIIAGLNILRYLLIRDKSNRTSIWCYLTDVEMNFLKPLRKAIDLTRAHFKQESFAVAQGQKNQDNDIDMTVQIINGDKFPEITQDKKLEILTRALNNFDLMDSLLARVFECIEMNRTEQSIQCT